MTVTSPTPNQTLPNSAFNVQATVIPTAAEPIQSEQVLLDFSTKVGSVTGSAIVNNVATIPIDLTAATNGMHYLTVQATDAPGATGSGQVNVLVSGPTSTTPFLFSVTPTFLRNNFTGYV